MNDFLIILIILFVYTIAVCLIAFKRKKRYNRRGFDRNHVHKNGTKYDNYGYDFYGYDVQGYNRAGFNQYGKNRKGQYDRYFDVTSREEGFYNLECYPVALSTHAKERFFERLNIRDLNMMKEQTINAYRFGKSKRQLKKTSAHLIDEIEQRHESGIVLIYQNYIYIFSCDNVLITLYKNDKIPL